MGNLDVQDDCPAAPHCDRCGIRSFELMSTMGLRSTPDGGAEIISYGLCCWYCREELPRFEIEPE